MLRLAGACRLLTFGLVPAMLAAILLPLQASAAPNAYLSFNEYPTSFAISQPFDIVTGPDGNIWYTASADQVVKADPATGNTLASVQVNNGSAGCDTTGITVGPDANIWVACFSEDVVVRITPSMVATAFPLPARAFLNRPEFLTAGPDGYLWFAERAPGYIAKMNPRTGSLYEYPLPLGINADPNGIAAGPDGNIWFTDEAANSIGKITTSGAVTEYPIPSASADPWGITTGPDGNLYFTEVGTGPTGTNPGKIGRSTTAGTITEFSIPTPNSGPRMITVGPDGNLWFAEFVTGKIASMTPAGGFSETSVPAGAGSQPFGVAEGPDGNLWFTEIFANNIGKVGVRHNILTLDKTAIGFGNVQLGMATATQRVTFTNTGAEALPLFTPTISTDNGGPSGVFVIAAQTCSAAPIAVAGTCNADVRFNANLTPGNATGTLTFQTQFGTGTLDPTIQITTAGLTATVVAALCTSVAISTDVASPQNVGTTVTLNATSLGCPDASPLYKFWIRDTSAVWHPVQDFSATASYVWNTTTWGQGTFLLGVWVKDSRSPNTGPNSYDAYAFGTFTLGLPTCSSVSLASDIASPQVVGVTVNFTATSIGCPAPLYQWFVRDAAGNWTIVPGHDFAHSSTTFAWNTTGLADGTYQVGVWAKQTGSSNSYDAFAFVTYTLTITHCTAVNLGTSIASPQATGAAITLTPTVTGCASPQYRFYVRDAAGTWHIQQDFGVGTTYTWNSSSTPVNTTAAGTFLLGVWAKQTGSTNSYDAFAFITFSLTSGTTCTVNIAADKTSPQALTTTVTWTAMASNCPNTPLKYQFWVNPPNGTWGIVQPFSTTTTFAWTGATAGTYQVGVWVKQANSTASYDNFAFSTFTLTPATPAQVCGSVGVISDVASPQLVGTIVTFTAVANGCGTPQYQWWVRDTSANWAIAKTYANSSPTLAWNTTGLAPGTYLIGVWARQTGSTASYEAYSFVTFTLTVPAGGVVCSSVGVSPSVPSPQVVGTSITFTATALGCSTPNYRFFIAPPSTGVFAQVQPFGAGNTFVWNTAGLAPGPYQVGVWARQQGSTASYEAFAFITFQIQSAGSPCTVLALWPTHGAAVNDITSQPPQPTGLTIVWSATASGCGTAEYKFYVAAPGSTYFIAMQAYSASATFSWNTAGLPAGTYRILVLARLAGSSNSYDVYVISTYELT
jgi:streptogramin lyase